METTHTMAGQLAHAGAARLRAAAPAPCPPAAVAASHGVLGQPEHGYRSTTWIQGALATPATFMVLDRKNRPTRPLPERSP